jgi:Cof subfamily protein (haloacid dehalogenase superfamily)
MGKFSGVLLVSDYDDTLYGSDFTVSEPNRAAIRYFIGEGGRFTVATGRARNTFRPQITRENLTVNAPAVLSNGALLYDFQKEQVICQTALPRSAPSDLRALMNKLPTVGLEVYHNEDLYIDRPNPYTDRHVARVKTGWTRSSLENVPTPWVKAIVEDDYGVLQEAQRFLLGCWRDRYEAIFSNRCMLELTARGAHKGGMVLRLADYLGIQREHIYCVGDNQNDIPMLAVSAIPFAPANCAQEVKDWGAAVLGSCDEDCIAQIVDILDRRY